MACVAMVKGDERNGKFCNAVKKKKRKKRMKNRGESDSEGCRRRTLIREPRSLDSTVGSIQIIHQIWKIISSDWEGIPQT